MRPFCARFAPHGNLLRAIYPKPTPTAITKKAKRQTPSRRLICSTGPAAGNPLDHDHAELDWAHLLSHEAFGRRRAPSLPPAAASADAPPLSPIALPSSIVWRARPGVGTGQRAGRNHANPAVSTALVALLAPCYIRRFPPASTLRISIRAAATRQIAPATAATRPSPWRTGK
jgi:hypothetical protein